MFGHEPDPTIAESGAAYELVMGVARGELDVPEVAPVLGEAGIGQP